MVFPCMPWWVHVTLPSPGPPSCQVQPTASRRCCRCCWATRTCSARRRRIWCGRAWISSWVRSRTVTGLQSWGPLLRGRTSWCTGATELQVSPPLTTHVISDLTMLLYCPAHFLVQVWRTFLQKPTWSIRSLSIWTRASAVESSCGRRACWRKDLGFVMESLAARTSSSFSIGSQATQNTSTEPRGKKITLHRPRLHEIYGYGLHLATF